MPKKTRADATDKFNIYYPEQNDKVDIAGDFKRLADSVETALENVDGTGGGPGTPGKDGVDGKSAYELAVEEGFIGTEPEWLESLQGADGADGADGANGTDGEDGAGLAEGGLANQILVKSTDNDFETEWKPLGTYTDLANFGSVVP